VEPSLLSYKKINTRERVLLWDVIGEARGTVGAFWLGHNAYARILLCRREIALATAGAWNFGLCATRSREPRQARKGATVPGLPRVPQTTRSSSHRKKFKAESQKLKSEDPDFNFLGDGDA
jgi:hypothetical protein